MKYKEVQITDDIFEETLDYLEVEELPSNYRYYNKQFPIYIRGLNLLEAEGISKLLDTTGDIFDELPMLLRVFRNAIKSEINLEDLEIYDFLILAILSSTITVRNFGWTPNINCENIVPNPDIKKIQNEINDISEQLANPELTEDEIKTLEEKLIEKQKELEELPKEVECGYLLNDTINLFNLEFEEPELTEFGEITINNEKCKLKPLLVKDVLAIKQFNEKEADFIEKIKTLPYIEDKTIEKYLILASLFEYKDLKENLKYLLNKIDKVSLEKLIDLEVKAKIKLKPISVRCKRCGHITKIYVDLFQIKAYP